MTSQTDNKNKQLNQIQTADLILQIVTQLSREMHHGKRSVHSVSLDSMLDRDLALDSLSRVELLQRIERKFQVRLPEKLLATAETPGDLLQGVMNAPGIKDISKISGIETAPTEAIETNPNHAQTLIDVLQWHVKKHPQRPHIYLYGDEDEPLLITYTDLFEGAQKIASGLQDYGIESGQTVAIMLPTGQDYLFTYFAILLVGAIPVPIYPPTRPSQLEEHLRRHTKILNNADSVLLITVKEAKLPGQLLKAQLSNLRHVLVVDELTEKNNQFVPIPVQGEDIAFLQYTSGSTGTPKGVVLTHSNLLANIRAMGQVVQVSSNDVFVSWLPLYHDMGLIGAWLGSLYYATPLVLMSPLTFLTRPSRWLWAIHKHKGTLSAAPNFAYEFCLSKIKDEDINELDLSSWRMAFNGAEPVNPKTLRDFAARFEHYGFHPEALSAVYGLAESAVGLAFPPPGRGALIDYVQRDALQLSGIAVAATQAEAHAKTHAEERETDSCLEFAACGQPLPGYQLRIVDHAGRELPERREGRLQFQGPSATSGYYHNPEQTSLLFDGEWLETGDLAYMVAGELYLTGRSKEIIIRAGRNIFPYEIEQAVGEIPGVRKGCVAVLGSHDKDTSTERIIILAETRETDTNVVQQLHSAIDQVTSGMLLGSSPDEILLLPPHSVLKTSSGKIRRTACRDLYEQGQISHSHHSIGLQLLRVAAAGLVPQLIKFWHRSLDNLFALWAWIIFFILAPISWFTVVLLPVYSLRRSFIRKVIQLFSLITGIPLRVYGIQNLPPDKTAIFICNHASYLDGIILMAALPNSFSFVAKKELENNFISRLFLQRINTVFVERFDIQRGAADAEVLQEQVKKGHSLVIFPEGTFTRITGLSSFRMGAFTTAVQTNKPVIPLTLRGTRSILGAATWYPRRGSISVNISKPVYPQASGWNEAIRLRDKARLEILKHYDEPDLAQ